MNLFRTRMFLRIYPLARIHPLTFVRYTRHPRLDPSPLRTPCPVITPEPAIHRQMNSRSELKSSYHVSSSISFICHVLYCSYACFVFTVSSPPLLSPVDPAATADYTAAEYDYSTDDRTPTVELPGKQSHSPLPHLAYLSVFIYCTRHMLLLR